MKKSGLFLSLLMLISLFSFTSCVNGGSKPPDGIDWSDGRTFLDESSLSGEVKKTTKVRIHYTRANHDYTDWDVWAWAYEPVSMEGAAYDFSFYDSYGVIADINLSSVDSTLETTKIGVIIRKGEWLEKDINKDRHIEIPETSTDGIYDVYMVEGKEKIYQSREDSMKEDISKSYVAIARKNSYNVMVYLNCDQEKISQTKLTLLEDGIEITDYTVLVEKSMKLIRLTMNEGFNFDLTKQYKIRYDFGEDNIVEKELILYNLYDSDAFSNEYNYDGDDLGVTFDVNKVSTTFKLWAPLSKKVTLNIYDSGTPSSENTPTESIEMIKGDKGVWSKTVEGYLHGKYYTYTVENRYETNEVVDPYAKSCGVNGRIGMIVDFDVINEELEWDKVVRPTIQGLDQNVDASIYEMHVRDMTIDETSNVSASKRGKFLGLTEEGTKYTSGGVSVTTGLDHLKELGVSHVQILPFYDYNSIDEADSSKQYNWGYDPLNYNCLEGSYSSDPTDGLVRIKEFKQMMKSLLANNIQVNMDVVYNHTAENDTTNFEKILPGYYHRRDTNFDYSNGSGCGNEMSSERYMYSKFIVESCKFWLEEYKLSGFRFDLMGLIDTNTMNKVYEECYKIYDKVMVYGEPWTGGTTTLDSTLQTNQSTVNALSGIVGAFNDKIRNAIKGDNSPGEGWVQGKINNANPIMAGLKGNFSGSIDPNKVINYVSCHDNYTLFDQLDKTLTGDRKSNIKDVYKQCEALVFTGQGITFMQEGEDFMRTKQAGSGNDVHNSYKAGDHVNKMDYALKLKNIDMFNYFKDLISFRKDHQALSLGSRNLINDNFVEVEKGEVIAFKVTDPDSNEELFVIHSLNAIDSYQLDGEYQLIFDHSGKVDSSQNVSSINLKANGTVILKKA